MEGVPLPIVFDETDGAGLLNLKPKYKIRWSVTGTENYVPLLARVRLRCA